MKYGITNGKTTWGAFEKKEDAEKIADRFSQRYDGGYFVIGILGDYPPETYEHLAGIEARLQEEWTRKLQEVREEAK